MFCQPCLILLLDYHNKQIFFTFTRKECLMVLPVPVNQLETSSLMLISLLKEQVEPVTQATTTNVSQKESKGSQPKIEPFPKLVREPVFQSASSVVSPITIEPKPLVSQGTGRFVSHLKSESATKIKRESVSQSSALKEPMSQSTRKFVSQSKSIPQVIKGSSSQGHREPLSQLIKEPMSQSIKEPMSQSNREPMSQSNREPVSQGLSEQQVTEEPVATPTEEPVTKEISEPQDAKEPSRGV